MTVVPLNPRPFRAAIIARLRKVGTRLTTTLDAFAEARLRAAIPKRYLRHEEFAESPQRLRKSSATGR